jgi:hypothetical protein
VRYDGSSACKGDASPHYCYSRTHAVRQRRARTSCPRSTANAPPYGPNYVDHYRQAASCVDCTLRPPAHASTRYETALKLKNRPRVWPRRAPATVARMEYDAVQIDNRREGRFGSQAAVRSGRAGRQLHPQQTFATAIESSESGRCCRRQIAFRIGNNRIVDPSATMPRMTRLVVTCRTALLQNYRSCLLRSRIDTSTSVPTVGMFGAGGGVANSSIAQPIGR